MINIKITKQIPVEGAVVVLLDADDQTLILLRPAAARWAPHKWGFPGGKLEPHETAEECAVRETREETQLAVTNLKLLDLKIDKPIRAYYTRDYEGVVEIDYEHDDWAWAPRDQIEQYDLAPQVVEMYDWALENGK